jgi:hypothetical protein
VSEDDEQYFHVTVCKTFGIFAVLTVCHLNGHMTLSRAPTPYPNLKTSPSDPPPGPTCVASPVPAIFANPLKKCHRKISAPFYVRRPNSYNKIFERQFQSYETESLLPNKAIQGCDGQLRRYDHADVPGACHVTHKTKAAGNYATSAFLALGNK